MSELEEKLFGEILMARRRVYAAGQPTPLQEMQIPGLRAKVFVKREDLGPIQAYKWRGAYNRMAMLTDAERAAGVVTASAGNHAQGVARAAHLLGTKARIYMPRSTPLMKQKAVARHGGEAVEIILTGDSYDAASAAARADAATSGCVYVHAYDDLAVMGGQGTLADEVVMSGHGPFTHVYLQIGGGGLAAATACWLKRYYPGIHAIGVEGVEQASMKAAIAADQPVELDYLDVFCDGTAVRKAGDLTFPLCRELIDEVITVSNDEVCAAVRKLWEASRAIPEPAGAMGLAGALQQASRLDPDDRVLVILCGANMDFSQLAHIARRGGGAGARKWIRFPMPEEQGALVRVLRGLPPKVDIFDVQYGKTGEMVSHPVLGLQAGEDEFAAMDAYFDSIGIAHEEVTTSDDVDYRIINYSPALFASPLFVRIEFPERPGAFLGFMERVADLANLCYFNYANTGERVGRALVGMEAGNEAGLAELRARLAAMAATHDGPIRACREVAPDALARILG